VCVLNMEIDGYVHTCIHGVYGNIHYACVQLSFCTVEANLGSISGVIWVNSRCG
jgi:hypothetical protein